MSRKSPYDIKSVDLDVASIVLRQVINGNGWTSYEEIDAEVSRMRFQKKTDLRWSRKTSKSTDELRELEWLGLVQVKDDKVLNAVPVNSLREIVDFDFVGKLERLYYEKEILYRIVVDHLQAKGTQTWKDIVSELNGKIMKSSDFPGYGLGDNAEVMVVFNMTKLFHIWRAGSKFGSLERRLQEGGTSRERDYELTIVTRTREADPRTVILRAYESMPKELTFVRISDLYEQISRRQGKAMDSEVFSKELLRLKDEFYPNVDLFQASGNMSVRDPLTGKHFHHIRIQANSIKDIISSLRR
jgi:hypothetical protein